MELTYRKNYSCRESSQPSLITQSQYQSHFHQVGEVLALGLFCFYRVLQVLSRDSFDANVLIASQCRWSSVERRYGQHRGRMMRGSGGFMGKARFNNLSRRELGDWPGRIWMLINFRGSVPAL